MAKIQDHPTSLLLVEGNDDFHVIHAFCRKLGISVRNIENPTGGNFSIIDCKGIEELFIQIPIRFKSSQSITTIGIIIDADTDLQKRWLTLKAILNTLEFEVPDKFPETGLILTKGKLKIGAWIMPNNNINGMLEDFLAFLIPKGDNLLPIVNSTLDEIEIKQMSKYSPFHKSKAIIHSWLAWQEVPGTPLGLSITKRYLTTDADACLSLKDWINKLFN
jgi:hypothetical protein